MIPPTVTNRELLCWIDAVAAVPMKITASQMGLNISTVSMYRISLYRKLECRDVAGLVRLAYGLFT